MTDTWIPVGILPTGPQGESALGLRLRGQVAVVPDLVPPSPPPQPRDAWFDGNGLLWVYGDGLLADLGLPGTQGAVGPQGPQGAAGPLGRTTRYARVQKTVAQAIANATWSTVTFNAASFDPSNMWNGVGALTIPQAGLYLVTFGGQFQAAGGQAVMFALYKNTVNVRNGIILNSAGWGGQPTAHTNSDIIENAVGDILQLWAYQNTGANLNVNSAYLSVTLLSEAA